MALPPNETVKTTIEMTQKVIGIDDLHAAQAATLAHASAIEKARLELIQYAKAAEQAYENNRKLAAAQGVAMPKFQQTFRQRVPVGYDPSGAANQFVELEAVAGQRGLAEIQRTAQARREMASTSAMAARLPLAGLLGGSSAANKMLQPLFDAISNKDSAGIANMRPLLDLITKNRGLLGGNLNIGGAVSSGFQQQARGLLGAGDVEGAIALLREGAAEQQTQDRYARKQVIAEKLKYSAIPGMRSRIAEFEESQVRRFGSVGADDASQISKLQTIIADLEIASQQPGTLDPADVKRLMAEFEGIAKPMERSSESADKASKSLDELESKIKSLGAAMDAATKTALMGQIATARQKISPAERDALRALGRDTEAASTEGVARSIEADIAPSVKKASDEVAEKTEKYKEEARSILTQQRREQLVDKYGTAGPGAAAAARMMQAEAAATAAEAAGASDEADMHRANAAAAQAELQAIDRNRAKSSDSGYRQRQGIMKGVNRLATGGINLGAGVVASDVEGLGTGIIGMGSSSFGAMRDIATHKIVHGGFTAGRIGAFTIGALGMGAAALAGAAYSRGGRVLDRAASQRAALLPQLEGVFAANPVQYSQEELLAAEIAQLEARSETGGARSNLHGAQETARERIAQKYAEEGGSQGARARLAVERRKGIEKEIFDIFGPGSDSAVDERGIIRDIGGANITTTDVAQVLAASGGRGVGAEFYTEDMMRRKAKANARNLIRKPGDEDKRSFTQYMPTEVENAAATAAYAVQRGLSVESVGRLAGMGSRFGITGVANVPGLVGAGGFGFRAGARDDFTNKISDELAAAGMVGGKPELERSSRFFQGAVNAGGNRERMAQQFLGSINAMTERRLGMFSGAEGFMENLMLSKALSKGGSIKEANRLLAEQAPGFTTEDMFRDAAGYKDVFEFQMLGKGLTERDINSLTTSLGSGGGDIKDEPIAEESRFRARDRSRAAQAGSRSEQDIGLESAMADVAATFDEAAATFKTAVDEFSVKVFK